MVAAAGAFAIVLIVAAAGIVGTRYLRPIPAPASPVVFEIPLTAAPINQAISISPDGRSIVYLTRTETRPMLTVRSLGELQPHLIAGTGGVSQFSQPFWSPDSHYIAFVADGKLKKIETNGSVPEVVAEVKTQFGGGTWGRDGTILFAANDHGVQSVSADGGPVTDVTTRDADDLYHDCPSLLTDGKRFLYLSYSDKPEKRAIYLAKIGSPGRTRLIAADACPRLTDRYLLILRGQAVVARPFDADKGEFTGDAIPIIDGVATFANGELGVFDASTSGVLVYRKRPGEAANRRLMWMDRGGKASEPVGPPIRTGVIQLTADGRRVVFAEPTDETPDDLWAYDFVRNVKTRLTTDPAPDHNPVVSADGKRVAWDAHRTTTATIWERDIDGAGADRQISQPEAGLAWSPRAYSPDGRFLLFGKAPSGTPPWDLWVLPLTGERKAIPYATSRFDETAAVLSPDGRWVAYATDEPGSYQIVVQPFPDPSSGGKWQVSMSGGAFPRWRRDGKELYYIAPSGDLMAATVNAGPAFAIGATTKLFRTPFAWSGTPAGLGFPYDVATDGRFLFSAPTCDPNAPPITTVLNWSSLLKR